MKAAIQRSARSTDALVVVRPSLGDDALAWDALADSGGARSPFLRSWWLDSCAGPGTQILLVVRAEEIIGGLALEQDRRMGIVRFRAGHGTLKPDHLDLVARPTERDDVVAAIRRWFVRPGSRLVDLSGFAERAVVTAALPRPVRTSVVGMAPWTRLPERYDDYLAQRPSQLRNSITRTGRRLSRLGAEYRAVGREDIATALETLRSLHSLRFGGDSGLLPEFDRFRQAAIAGSRRGEVTMHELVVEGRVITTEVWFEVGGIASFYQSGRDPDPQWNGAGTVLKARIIEGLCARGFTHIDLLRDDEPYKRSWAEGARPLVRLEAATGLRARTVAAMFPGGRRALRVARSALRWTHSLRHRRSTTSEYSAS